jgi:hypothetical protein
MKYFSSSKLHGFVGTFLVKMLSAPDMGTLSATLLRFRLKWGVSYYPHLLSVLRVGRVFVFGGNGGLIIGLGGYDGAQYPTSIRGHCFHVVGLALGV